MSSLTYRRDSPRRPIEREREDCYACRVALVCYASLGLILFIEWGDALALAGTLALLHSGLRPLRFRSSRRTGCSL